MLDSIAKIESLIPWKQVAGMRDVLIHDYFGVNLHRVWNVITEELGELKDTLQQIQNETVDEIISPLH